MHEAEENHLDWRTKSFNRPAQDLMQALCNDYVKKLNLKCLTLSLLILVICSTSLKTLSLNFFCVGEHIFVFRRSV